MNAWVEHLSVSHRLARAAPSPPSRGSANTIAGVEWRVAASLHDVVLGHTRSLGIGEARLWVLEENGRARRFYERHAFVAAAHGFEATWQLEDVKYRWVKADVSD